MQITIKETELEEAVRDYVKKCGITQTVGKINFSVSRNPTSITTEIEVGVTSNTTAALTVVGDTVDTGDTPAEETVADEASEEDAPVEAKGNQSLFKT